MMAVSKAGKGRKRQSCSRRSLYFLRDGGHIRKLGPRARGFCPRGVPREGDPERGAWQTPKTREKWSTVPAERGSPTPTQHPGGSRLGTAASQRAWMLDRDGTNHFTPHPLPFPNWARDECGDGAGGDYPSK